MATTLIAAKASLGVKDVDGRTEVGGGGGVGLVLHEGMGKFGSSHFFLKFFFVLNLLKST